MGANAVTTFPTYTTGQVLEAADLNITNCGVPVFAGTVERDAAFGGTGEKVLAEGQLCYLESTNVVQYYDGATWATVGPTTPGGMTLLSTTTLAGASTTVTISDFSYVYLYGVVYGMTNATGAGATTLRPNASTTIFHGIEIFNGNGTFGSGANTDTTIPFVTTPTRTDANNIWSFMITNYASSTNYKTYSATMGAVRNAGGTASGSCFGYIKTNSQISSLVFVNAGGDWTSGTVLLYGVK